MGRGIYLQAMDLSYAPGLNKTPGTLFNQNLDVLLFGTDMFKGEQHFKHFYGCRGLYYKSF